MSYLVLARKYRPAGFDDFVGQGVIAQTLRNAIRLERVAHGYLFCGPRGVGKTSMARVFAKALNCVEGPTCTPCGKCSACKSISRGEDVDVIEIDGASNRGIDAVREIRQNARYAASHSRFKIYIIDEVHMLTEPAFNALLKTLEEPPPHVKFFLATTAPAKLPETILSRVQRFDFRRISTSEIAKRLAWICEQENVKGSFDVCLLVARRGRGSMRDALSLMDQVFSLCGDEQKFEDVRQLIGALSDDEMGGIMDMVRAKDSAGLVYAVAALLKRGMDAGEVVDEMVRYLRDLLVARVCGPDEDLLDRPGEAAGRLVERARELSPEEIIYMVEVLNSSARRLREGQDERVVLEMALVKLAESDGLRPVGELIERLAVLEESAGASVTPDAAVTPARSTSVVRETVAPGFGERGETSPDVWKQVLQAAHVKSSWLHMCLCSGHLERIEGDVAVIGFSPEGSFRADVQKPEYRQTVEGILSEVIGRPMRIRLVTTEEPGDAPEAVASAAAPKDEMVQETVRRFKGTRVHG